MLSHNKEHIGIESFSPANLSSLIVCSLEFHGYSVAKALLQSLRLLFDILGALIGVANVLHLLYGSLAPLPFLQNTPECPLCAEWL